MNATKIKPLTKAQRKRYNETATCGQGHRLTYRGIDCGRHTAACFCGEDWLDSNDWFIIDALKNA